MLALLAYQSTLRQPSC